VSCAATWARRQASCSRCTSRIWRSRSATSWLAGAAAGAASAAAGVERAEETSIWKFMGVCSGTVPNCLRADRTRGLSTGGFYQGIRLGESDQLYRLGTIASTAQNLRKERGEPPAGERVARKGVLDLQGEGSVTGEASHGYPARPGQRLIRARKIG